MRGLKQLPEQHPSAVSPLVQAGQLPILDPILQISLKPFSQLGPALSLFPFQHDIHKKPRASSASAAGKSPWWELQGPACPGQQRLHELRGLFHSCDPAPLIPGEFLKITWMRQETAEQGWEARLTELFHGAVP